MNWQAGMRAVCISRGIDWKSDVVADNGIGPRHGEVNTVLAVSQCKGFDILMFEGYEHESDPWYYAYEFRPVDELHDQLERIEAEGNKELQPQEA